MCDTQLLAGLGILISGFIDLRCGISGISAYHFRLVILLAWFSNVTHTAGLTVLRRYLHKRFTEMCIRITGMILLFFMLITGFVPTIFFNWATRDNISAALPGSPAICLFNFSKAREWHALAGSVPVEKTVSFQTVLMSLALLVFTLISRCIKFFARSSKRATKLRQLGANYYKNAVWRLYNKVANGWWCGGLALIYIQLPILVPIRLFVDLLSSTLSDVSSRYLTMPLSTQLQVLMRTMYPQYLPG
jgi:hypothetical protein